MSLSELHIHLPSELTVYGGQGLRVVLYVHLDPDKAEIGVEERYANHNVVNLDIQRRRALRWETVLPLGKLAVPDRRKICRLATSLGPFLQQIHEGHYRFKRGNRVLYDLTPAAAHTSWLVQNCLTRMDWLSAEWIPRYADEWVIGSQEPWMVARDLGIGPDTTDSELIVIAEIIKETSAHDGVIVVGDILSILRNLRSKLSVSTNASLTNSSIRLDHTSKDNAREQTHANHK